MKKLLIIILLAFLAINTSYSQGDLKIGAHAGLPMGDTSDFSEVKYGADLAYLFALAGIVEVGPMVGYSQFAGEGDGDGRGFVPVAASGRLGLALVFVGLDLGYALSTEDGADGGVFYQPKVGMGFVFFNIIASYTGINVNESNFSSLNLGIELSL